MNTQAVSRTGQDGLLQRIQKLEEAQVHDPVACTHADLQPASFAPDRSLRVPAGMLVRTGYVSVWKCQLAQRSSMAVGDVEGAHRRLLQLGPDTLWPCVNGWWHGDEFVINDGRHEYVAALMLGRTHILVAWLERADGQ